MYKPINLPEGFTHHDGGACPVPHSTRVAVWFRDGTDDDDEVASFCMHDNENWWEWVGSRHDNIVGYKVLA